MTENVKGYGTYLGMGTATGTSLPAFAADVYQQVLDIEEMTPPSPTRENEEWKVLDLKASKKQVGSISYSALTATLTRAFGDTVQDQLEDDVNAESTPRRNWKFKFPNAGEQTHYFAGQVSKFEYQGITNDGRIQFTLEIVVDGVMEIER